MLRTPVSPPSDPDRRRERSDRRRPLCLALAVIAAVSAGCGGSAPTLLEHLEKMEIDVPLESPVDLAFGEFDVPVVVAVDAEDGPSASAWMRLRFKLWGQTTPEERDKLAKAYDQHQGALNDAVVTIVRTSTVEELTDPRLGAIKNRVAETARPLLGEERLRQLVLTEIRTEAL